MMTALVQDLRNGLRAARARPAVMVAALLTLALGIGATTAVFTVVNGVLLRPLRYRQPEQLVHLYRQQPPVERSPVSRPVYLDLAGSQRSFQALAAHHGDTYNLTGAGAAERLAGSRVTGSFFPLFGTQALRGRLLGPEDDRPGADPVAVIGEGLWRRSFGGAADVVGRRLTLNGRPHTIVGVAPAFQFPASSQIWTPAGLAADPRGRGNNYLMMLGRLGDGVSARQAEAELDQLAAALGAAHPENERQLRITVAPMLEDQVRDVDRALWGLLGAVALVLLIACANVANLLLVRATERQHEFAVRVALGAGVGRIVRQLLAESLLLALASGLVGLLLGGWAVDGLMALAPAALPRAAEIQLGWPVLAFGLALALITGVAFGLAPALRLARAGALPALKHGGRALAGSAPQARLRRGLVVAELALSLVLLLGAGHLVDGLRRLMAVDPGFRADHLLAADISHARRARTDGALSDDEAHRRVMRERAAFLAAVESKVAALPGVRAVGIINDLPVTGDASMSGAFAVAGRSRVSWANAPVADRKFVSAGYFAAMGIPLRRGRAFDGREAPAGAVPVVINEALARRFFAGEEPVGRRLEVPGIPGLHEIIGVVGDARQRDLYRPASPEVYFSGAQLPLDAEVTLVARTAGDPAGLAAAVRAAVTAVDPAAPVFRVRTMNQVIATALAHERFTTALTGGFAAIALVLAVVGLGGVMAYLVAQRRTEIGVRAALGARARQLMALVLAEGLKLALVGAAIGLAAGLALARAFAALTTPEVAQGMRAGTVAAVTLLLLGAALLATYLPARRAARIQPMVALKQE